MIEADPNWRPFSCDIQPEREAVRVVPRGELDLSATEPLRAHIDELLEAGFGRMVLDLRDVTFMDSSGLRMILEAAGASRERGVGWTVLPGPPAVQRIFEMTHTTELVFGGASRR